MIQSSNKFNFQEIGDMLKNEYFPEVVRATTEVVPKVAREAAKKLRQSSPRGQTGDYARNWKSKVEKGRIRVIATVYGEKPTYRLAHLLEFGHASRGGGRSVQAIEHIAPVEEWAINEAYDQIMDRIEGI